MKRLIVAVKSMELPYQNNGIYYNEDIGDMLETVGVWTGPRESLEEDPTFRQIIPYVVLTQDNKYLTYVRTSAGNEDRLHNKMSIGLGGHIDIQDLIVYTSGICMNETIGDVAYREVYEEVMNCDVGPLQTIGVLIDNDNDVGRVHLGIVLTAEINSGDVPIPGEDQISEIKLLTLKELREQYDQLETWSQKVVDYLQGRN